MFIETCFRRILSTSLATLALSVFSVGILQEKLMAEPISAQDVISAQRARLVSIGGAVTETIYALGLDDKVIAVDTTSIFPVDAQSKPNVGYMRALSAEGVLSTNPSLIVAIEGSGPKETINLLSSASIPLLVIPDTYTADGVANKITMIGDALGASEKAGDLARVVKADLSQLSKAVGTLDTDTRKKVLFVLSTQGGRVMAAGTNTSADAMIKLAGGINVLDDIEGYKPVSPEALSVANPDVILTINRGNHTIDPASFAEVSGLKSTKAVQNKAIIAMDGHFLLGFGPSIANAVRDLAKTLYPEQAKLFDEGLVN